MTEQKPREFKPGDQVRIRGVASLIGIIAEKAQVPWDWRIQWDHHKDGDTVPISEKHLEHADE